jgi:hypothetical protein
MVYYRVVRHIDDGKGGVADWSIAYESLSEAYKQCILSDETETCRRLLNGVQSEIQKGQRFIRVTCDRGSIWWIQLIDDPNEAVGPMSEATAKIDCCHAHK